MNNRHCTPDELNALVDGRMESSPAAELRQHIAGCTACRRALDILEGLDASLRALPLEKAPESIEAALQKELAVRPSLLFRILSNAGYDYGVMVVVGIMLWVFLSTGVLETSKIQQQGAAAGAMANAVGETAARGFDAFSAVLTQYIPFAFSPGSKAIVMMIAVALLFLVAMDRLVGRKMRHRMS